MRVLAAAALLAALLLAATAASAHGPPAPKAQETYLIVDHNDDCGGDSANDLQDCQGTHDLVALYLSETYDAALGELVNLRLMVNGGAGTLKDVITLKANGQAKSFELSTTDNQAFAGKGCDAPPTGAPALTPSGSQDGERRIVQCSVKLSALGGAGAKLTEFAVEASKGSTKGDYMPGGYYTQLGTRTENPPQGDAVTNRVAPSYTLRGPSYYVGLSMPTTPSVPADGQTTATLTLTNALHSASWDTAQLVTLSVSGADGFTATWVGGLGSDPTKVEVDLAKDATRTPELRLRGDGHAPATGTLTITVDTSLGGHSVHQLPYEIVAAAATPTDEGGSASKGGAGNDAPWPAAALVAVTLLAVAALRRRA